MSSVSHKVLHGSHLALRIDAQSSDDSLLFRWSGVLDSGQELEIDSFSSELRSWVCVSARTQSAIVLVSYDEGSDEFVVEPGAPLVFLATSMPTSVVVTPSGHPSSVEVMVCPSEYPFVGAGAFLVLDAGLGVRVGGGPASQYVAGWRDVRPESGAPLEWVGGGAGPIQGFGSRLISSDPDFNGHASIVWESPAGDDQANYAAYIYPAIADLWDFMGESGEFLWMGIVKVYDVGGSHTLFWPAAGGNGTELRVDGGYRVRYTANGTGAADETDEDEIVEGSPIALIVRQSQTDGVSIYYQGRWRQLVDSLGANDGESVARPAIGYTPSNAAVNIGKLTANKIANIHIWNSIPENEQEVIDAYLAMAVDYGVVDSQLQGHPFVSEAYAMWRANRGVAITPDATISNPPAGTTFSGDAMVGWGDTRPESAAGGFAASGDISTTPAFESDAIHAYGGSNVAEVGHRMETANDTESPIESGEFTILAVFEPTADGAPSTHRGGVVLSTGGFTNPDALILSLDQNGDLRFFLSATGETDIDLTLPMGLDTFGHAMAVVVSLGNGAATLSAKDLVTGQSGFTGVEVASWPGTVTGDALVLFDFDAYYGVSQWFEGRLYEATITPSRETDDDVNLWYEYAQRRYGP